jgi:hypothetical protein
MKCLDRRVVRPGFEIGQHQRNWIRMSFEIDIFVVGLASTKVQGCSRLGGFSVSYSTNIRCSQVVLSRIPNPRRNPPTATKQYCTPAIQGPANLQHYEDGANPTFTVNVTSSILGELRLSSRASAFSLRAPPWTSIPLIFRPTFNPVLNFSAVRMYPRSC